MENIKKGEVDKWLSLKVASAKRLSEIFPDCETDFEVGDIISYTNPYGVVFDGLQIAAISKSEWDAEHCIYLYWDCYWYPVRPSDINKSNKGAVEQNAAPLL